MVSEDLKQQGYDKENEHFHRKDKEAIEKLRKKLAEEKAEEQQEEKSEE
ncbi:hypothetical protein SCOR_09225 [Sulfidibacter corallicola]|uniref:Uncharacterized protein n=1 Tax=Sulfidibacter corallicola TaxID=2818388 RepID=A0A8A4TQ60_SULCO|nr:hypothetical protein [Sulfidibacter corallicola]QTD51061.1 hypothetical protein J3U87_01210 [Sulfidibacter corallicola]